MSIVCALDNHGLEALKDIAVMSPKLFLSDDVKTLLTEVRRRAAQGSIGKSDGFLEERQWDPVDLKALDRMKNDVVAGPDRDAYHARLFRQWLPKLTASDAADPGVLTSICCFHLGGAYIHERWNHGTGAVMADKNPDRYVKKHWLVGSNQDREQANTAGRLWWLYESAKRAESHSAYDIEKLLDLLAGNRGLYHGVLRFPVLKASNRILAAIVDVAVDNRLFRQQDVVGWLSQINRRGGAISLDVLDDEDLKRVVRDCLPPKGGAGP